MKKKNFILGLLGSFVLSISNITFLNAEGPVKLDAYYDTFIFKVNDKIQIITEGDKKPFVAQNRTYVPLATLNDLGIAVATWIPPVNGNPSQVLVTPAENNSKNKYYESKIKELTDDIAKKDSEIKELNKKLNNYEEKKKEEENEKLDEREIKNYISDLQRNLNRDRRFNEVYINRDYFDLEYDIRYRRNFDISIYIKDLDQKDIEYLGRDIRNERQLKELMEDIIDEIKRKKQFKNNDIYFTIEARVRDKNKDDETIGAYYCKDGKKLEGEIYRPRRR